LLYITAKYHEEKRLLNNGFFLFSTEFSNHVIEKMLLQPCKFHVFNSKSALLSICSVARSETCKRDWTHTIYPNDQRWLVAGSITLAQIIPVEKMKYQSYNIKAGVVHELKIKVKLNKVIKWFVLLLWYVRPWQKKLCLIRVTRVFYFIPALPLIK
jgi:hypothetical protein